MTRSRWVTALPAIVAAVALGVLVALADGPSTTMPAAAPLSDPAGAFQRAFKAAATAAARRDLVMKACDDRLISSRMSLDDLKNLFGDSPMFTLFPADKETGNQSALLQFFPPEPETMPAGFAAQVAKHERAWFMRFFFEHGDLRLYYLSNYGKSGGPLVDPAGDFPRAFKSAATPAERRELVMKACDDGVINSRMSLDDLKKLFADSPMFTVHPADKETAKQSALLYFEPPQPAPTQPAAAAPDQTPHQGWYMWFMFEHDNLSILYLTNYGK